jgi:hypothetical protein
MFTTYNKTSAKKKQRIHILKKIIEECIHRIQMTTLLAKVNRGVILKQN